MHNKVRVKPKIILDSALFLLTGVATFIPMVSLNAVGDISAAAEVQQPADPQKSNRDDTNPNETVINDEIQVEQEYIDRTIVSFCESEYLEKYNFEDVLVVGDKLSRFIFPKEEEVEYKCV